MTTKKLLEKIPEKSVDHLRFLGAKYNSVARNGFEQCRMEEYTRGLCDAGLINERESVQLCIYAKLVKEYKHD